MNVFAKSLEGMRRDLFRTCGLEAVIRRVGNILLSTNVILAKVKFEDADGSIGRYNTFYMDVLISADDNYLPQAGDTIEVDNSTYIVKPITNELWSYDDTCKMIMRVHAQKGR